MKPVEIGRIRVENVVEWYGPTRPTWVLPDAAPEAVERHRDWLAPHFMDARGRFLMSIHSFILRAPGLTVLVDTCVGNDKPRQNPGWHMLQTDFLDRLAAAGCPPESVDLVLCTHLHVDHVGWNTRLDNGRWVPTFPRARYLMGRVEFAHWRDEQGRDDMAAVFADSVAPIHAAGLADLVETTHRICDEISLAPTVGHTPGHVSVRIASEGEEALITGDFMHHPCQIARPDWSSTADSDPDQARHTRQRMLGELCDRPVLVIGTHFAGATAGHIVRDGETYRLAV